jgi:hypothetical protein
MDSWPDYSEMRQVIPKVYRALLDQTFFLKWPREDRDDRDSEYARFSAASSFGTMKVTRCM